MKILELLKENLFNIVKEYRLNQAEEYWNFKREPKNISYVGRYLPFKDEKISVPLQLFITPNDPMIMGQLRFNILFVKDRHKCDKDIMNIYKFTRIKPSNPYVYKSDSKTAGVNEFWYFPFELRNLRSGDCDDYAVELASYLIAAGVPRFRVRCVAGLCRMGGGHLTVYVLGDDLKTWYHLNSTTPYDFISGKRSITNLPKSGDETDRMGIEHVWFSFNDKYSWNDFETQESENSFYNFVNDVVIE